MPYGADGGRARLILAALVTPARIQDNTPMVEGDRWGRFRWTLQPSMAVGDAKEGSVPKIVGRQTEGIRPYWAPPDFTKRSNGSALEAVRYDRPLNGYGGSPGHCLPLSS